MRILIFGNLTPYVPGGAERQVRLLAEGWARLGHQVAVVGSRLPDAELDIDGNTIKLFKAPVYDVLGRPGRSASYFLSLCRVLYRLRGQYDIIYCRFLTDSACSVAFLKQLKLVCRPLVACPASSGPGGDAEFLRSLPFTSALVSMLSSQCDAINLISGGIEDEIKSLNIKPGRWFYIHNGVTRASAPGKMPGNETLRLIFVGGLREQKGVDLLLHAVSEACRLDVKLTVDLIGDGPDRRKLQDLAESLQLGEITCFHGVLSSEEVAEHIRRSHVLVLPSRWEGMANVALEAMAAGRPVIASRCGGIDRFIGPECGWTIDIDDRAALVSSICSAARLSLEELESMGQASFKLVEQKFNMDLAVTEYLDMFTSVLGMHSSAS